MIFFHKQRFGGNFAENVLNMWHHSSVFVIKEIYCYIRLFQSPSALFLPKPAYNMCSQFSAKQLFFTALTGSVWKESKSVFPSAINYSLMGRSMGIKAVCINN